MISFQQKFMDALDKEATAHEQDLVVNYSYSNTGSAYVQMKDSFINQFTFTFDFQTSYCVFTFYINNVEVKRFHYVLYSDTNEVEELLGVFSALCVGGYTGE